MKETLSILEFSIKSFYHHVNCGDPKTDVELHWENGEWKFRLEAYKGEWSTIKSPMDIEGINLKDLYTAARDILYYHYAYVSISHEDELFRKRLENHFGKRNCALATAGIFESAEALAEHIKKVFPAKQ